MLLAVAGAVFGLLCPCAAIDPAPGWLGYAKATGNGRRITRISADWIVPTDPTNDGIFFGIWYGIEPNPAMNLIQPVLPWSSGWMIYNEYFQWQPMNNIDSSVVNVVAGNHIRGTVVYRPESNLYEMTNTCVDTGKSSTLNITIQDDPTTGEPKVFTDAYFVMEKEASQCDMYSPDGKVSFTNIVIEYDGKPAPPKWSTHYYDDVCNCRAHIISEDTVELTWDTTGPGRVAK